VSTVRRAAVVALAAAAVAAPWVVDEYGAAMFSRVLVLGLVAASVALLTGVAGLPTLGQTAPYAAGAYACALLSLHAPTVGVVQVLAGAAAGALFALFTAPLVVHARGVVLLMITLAVGELATTAAGRWRSVTGGTDGLAGFAPVPPVWGLPALDGDRARYLYALAVVAAVLGLLAVVLRGPAGLLLRAGRDDEARLRASGHRVTGYVVAAFVAAGAVAGVAGSLLVTTQQYVSPADFGFDLSTLLLLGVVIGGAESLGGAIVGTALVIAVRDWLSGVLPGQAPLLLGLAFVLAAYPTGGRLRRPGGDPRGALGPLGPVGRSGRDADAQSRDPLPRRPLAKVGRT
jgi:branched-chain amino acid transport system permease protein